jgi:hypothetical protein
MKKLFEALKAIMNLPKDDVCFLGCNSTVEDAIQAEFSDRLVSWMYE